MLINLLWTTKPGLARLARKSLVQCDECALNLASARTQVEFWRVGQRLIGVLVICKGTRC